MRNNNNATGATPPTNCSDLREKAEAGSLFAQTALGICYLDGVDAQVDYSEAYRFLSMAAERGASRAQLALGQMYAEGLGVSIDRAQALRLFELTADRGEFIAQIELGRLYSRGFGVATNKKLALKWYSAAAAQESGVEDCKELREAKAYLANTSREK